MHVARLAATFFNSLTDDEKKHSRPRTLRGKKHVKNTGPIVRVRGSHVLPAKTGVKLVDDLLGHTNVVAEHLEWAVVDHKIPSTKWLRIPK